jgi:hypothetical protein
VDPGARTLAHPGPGRHHGCPPVRPSDLCPDQGLVRATPSGEAEPRAPWCAGRRTLELSSHFSAVTQLKPRSFRLFPLGNWPGFGSPASVKPALRGETSLYVARCSLLLQRWSNPAYQQGHPVARPATVSSLDRDTLADFVPRLNGSSLWKLLTGLLIKPRSACRNPDARGRLGWRSTWRLGSN